MRRFLYFLPGASACDDATVARVGLADRFPGLSIDAALLTDGPAGMGVLLAQGGQPVLYLPDAQHWMKGDNYWVGMEKDLPPRPGDLMRHDSIGGYELALGDGNNWVAPCLLDWNVDRRAPDAPSHFPARLTTQSVLEGGACKLVIRPRYREANAIAAEAFAGFCQARTAGFADLFVKAAKLLAVNYRVGVEEVNLLGLFDAQSVARILCRSFDWPAFTESLDGSEPVLLPTD